jgi:hypothetical protein
MHNQIVVPSELFDEVEAKYAPPDHPVFELVPPPFHDRAVGLYAKMGQPSVSSDTFWDIYCELLQRFREVESNAALSLIIETHRNAMDQIELENTKKMELLPNMKAFRNGSNLVGPKGHRYIGGLINPPTQGLRGSPILAEEDASDLDCGVGPEPEYADFTTDDDESDMDSGAQICDDHV